MAVESAFQTRGKETLSLGTTDHLQPAHDQLGAPRLDCSVGIMAYNEEANIGQLLKALVTQRTSAVTLSEIVVVASGCTDGTQAIVKAWCRRDSRVRRPSR